MNDLLEWITELNEKTHVKIEQIELDNQGFWFFDEKTGWIRNKNDSFFQIAGIQGYINGEYIEQPIIIQDEIGYLGILCKDFNGVTKYLMQAKIEPGNINCVQISPTIQATKSNFTQKHGGKCPLYLEYFMNASPDQIIADQIQSEQSSRFYGKRNRNMIVKTQEDIKVDPRFRWMTLVEIKELMKYKNLVNMDTRTVLSCLPFIDKDIYDYDKSIRMDQLFYNSVLNEGYIKEIKDIYHKINNYKMFHDNKRKIVPLTELSNWEVRKDAIECKSEFPYKVIFCDIEIEGREVTHWQQPLFKANGIATFGLIRTCINNMYKYLVKITPEIGCFDNIEIGPTIQKEYGSKYDGVIEELFEKYVNEKKGVHFDSILSEEGGRFYHEENRNIIIDVPIEELMLLPDDYMLVSYRTLNHLNLVNNCLNIQLRNLMSTMEVKSYEKD